MKAMWWWCIALGWATVCVVGVSIYVHGYRAGQDGSTLDPAGTWSIIFGVIFALLLGIAIGATKGDN